LDLGCGLGHKTIGFASEAKRVLAVDLSENAISSCKKLYPEENIEFIAKDAKQIHEKFDVITAFGFSLFNTDDLSSFLANVTYFIEHNLKPQKGSVMIIGSFTDFSGEGKDSWYLHTKEELLEIQRMIKESVPSNVTFVFPHRKVQNYFGYGLVNLGAEFKKLISKRKKTFFIRIEHE